MGKHQTRMPTSQTSNQPAAAAPTDRVRITSRNRKRKGAKWQEHTVSYWVGGKRKRRTYSLLAEAEEDKRRTEQLLAAGDENGANMP